MSYFFSIDLTQLPIAVWVVVISAVFWFYYTADSKPVSKQSDRTTSHHGGKPDISVSLKHEVAKSSNASISGTDSRLIHPATFKPFTILQIKSVSHDTKLFRLEIPFNKSLDLPIGRHISIRAEVDGTKVIRAYTPVSHVNQSGYFDLLIKAYEFGKLSSYLHSLHVGDTIDIRGPIGKFQYRVNQFPAVGLIAGGTGITPALQFIRCLLEGTHDIQNDTTKLVLFYQNRSERDILLKTDIDALAQRHPDRLRVIYFLSNPLSVNWGHSQTATERIGYISMADVQSNLRPELVPFVGICGPSGFNNYVKDLLLNVNHSENSVHVW